MKRKKKDFKKHGLLKSIIISLLFAGIYYYISYPALDIHNLGLWVYIISVLLKH